MKRFELLEPTTLDEAVALLDPRGPGRARDRRRHRADADDEGAPLPAGASRQSPAVRTARCAESRRWRRPPHRCDDDAVRARALTARACRRSRPDAALRTLSNVRIRNVATLGGHLAHGDPHMDLPPILMTLGARVRAVGRRGERWIDMADFAVGYYQTALARRRADRRSRGASAAVRRAGPGIKIFGAVGRRLADGWRRRVGPAGGGSNRRGARSRSARPPSGPCDSLRRKPS